MAKHIRSQVARTDEAWLKAYTPRNAEEARLIEVWSDPQAGRGVLSSANPERVAHRFLLRQADDTTFAGIDIRSITQRAESWWTDLKLLIEEWWSFNKVTVRVVRGKLEAKIEFPGNRTRNTLTLLVKGPPAKPTVYVGGAEKQFGPNDSLRTIIYWIDGVTRP